MRKFKDLREGCGVYIYNPEQGLCRSQVASVYFSEEGDLSLCTDLGTFRIIDPESSMTAFNGTSGGPFNMLFSDLSRFVQDRDMIAGELAKALVLPGTPIEIKLKWSEIWETKIPGDLERIRENELALSMQKAEERRKSGLILI